MRRLILLGMLPVFAGLLWAVACDVDYRHNLPLRPIGDAAVPVSDLATAPADLSVKPADMNRPPDMTANGDLAPPIDMTAPPIDMTAPPDMTTATDM